MLARSRYGNVKTRYGYKVRYLTLIAFLYSIRRIAFPITKRLGPLGVSRSILVYRPFEYKCIQLYLIVSIFSGEKYQRPRVCNKMPVTEAFKGLVCTAQQPRTVHHHRDRC